MARGWESKSVEQQQEELFERRKTLHLATSPGGSQRNEPGGSQRSEKDRQRAQKRDGLLLSRQRLLQQLQTACNPRHRQMLELSLAELDRQLSSLEQVTDPKTPK
jgi:hypothetical protein